MQQHRVETQILHEEQILEAIDQLRRRKARPDADRICNYLLRKFSVDARDTIADLHRLIEAEKVIQVDYKGNTSYRNASKWSRLQLYKNRPEGFVKEKLNSSMVAGAVAELVVEEPDYLDQGVPAYRLVEQLLDGVSNPTSRRMVEDFLAKEVASGNIARLTNGNYSLVATTDMTITSAESTSITTTTTTTATTTTTTTPSSSSSSSSSSPITITSVSANHQNNNNISNNNNSNGTCSNNNNNNNHNRNNNNNNSNTSGNRANQRQREAEEEEQEEKEKEKEKEKEEEEENREGTNTNSRCYGASNESATEKVSCLSSAKIDNTRNATTTKIAISDNLGLYDFDDNEEDEEVMVTDSRSNTPRSSSRQSSPRGNDNPSDKNNKEECYGINGTGKEPDSPEESVTKEDNESRDEDSLRVTRDKSEKDAKVAHNHFSNLKRSTKAERKQRLLVRAEDPMDIEMKFENFGSDEKEEREKNNRDCEIGQNSDERDDDEAGRSSSTNPSPTPSNPTVGGFRSARRKRAKKVFDPSENNVVKRRRGRPVSTHKAIAGSQESQDSNKSVVKEGPNRQCSLCAKDKSESLVACRDCTVRAHPTCIYPPDELHQKSGSSWQCERCKSCTVCCETSDIGPLITCNGCDEAYHYSCHAPRISVPKANSKWKCNDCTQKHFKSNVVQTVNLVGSRPETPSNPPVLPPVLSPQVSPTRASDEQMDDEQLGTREGIDPNIPDASDWTSEQVYQYFARLFPKEAEVFRVQDIDGHSLLLMKRSDVLSGLDLLLGPALKIYRHVLKLQMRRDDPRLYWL